VEYRWDADTDILTDAERRCPGTGMSGSVEIEGSDGSWLIFDVSGGRIAGLEVAVWPDVRKLNPRAAGGSRGYGHDSLAFLAARVGSLEIDTRLVADADAPNARSISGSAPRGPCAR